MTQVDALWQPELTVIPGNVCNAYQGVNDISADRLGVACSVCGRSSEGAVLRCSSSHCSVAFHPLCARNAGQYLAVKETGNKTSYKAFCTQHSQQARAKDREMGLGIEVLSVIKLSVMVSVQPIVWCCRQVGCAAGYTMCSARQAWLHT